MWGSFIAQNLHFALMLYAALAFLGVAWLYFDAWLLRRRPNEILKWVGALIGSGAFFMHAITIDRDVLGTGLFGSNADTISDAFRLIAYIIMGIGIAREPLQEVPLNPGLELSFSKQAQRGSKKSSVAPAILGPSSGFTFLLPFASGFVGWLYWQRATKGLERHLKPISRAFALLALSELIGVRRLFVEVSNPTLAGWFSAYGPWWWAQHVVLAVAIVILCRWVWGYLIERFVSQLVLVFTSMVVIIFLVICVSFTGLLMRNVQKDATANLETASKVLVYALESKENETLILARQFSSQSPLTSAVATVDSARLLALVTPFMSEHDLSSLIITDVSGKVLLRGEDSEVKGDSLSADRLTRRALLGLEQTSVESIPSAALANRLVARSVIPIKNDAGAIVGSVSLARDLDAAFVDGLHAATELEVDLYSGKTLVASTTGGVGREIAQAKITEGVIDNGKTVSGTFMVNNRSVLAVFTPLKDSDDGVVGMVSLAVPAISVLQTAGKSVELTFGVATLLLALSFVPTYLVARNLKRQLQ